MNDTDTPVRTKRPYRRITKDVVARFQAEELAQGNGSAAVAVLEPNHKSPSNKASRIRVHAKDIDPIVYLDQSIIELSTGAIDRVKDMVNSTDEAIATRNAHFVIDHVRGKAVQRNENHNVNINIESVLE